MVPSNPFPRAMIILDKNSSRQCLAQVMYPWRSMFRAMFRQDRERGALYCLRAKTGADGRPLVVTQLGVRLAGSGADWASWAKSLAALLELLEDEMPTLPLRCSAEDDPSPLARAQGSRQPPALPDCNVGI